MEKKYLTQKKLVEITGVKNSQINYLVQEGIIPCKRFGSSIFRQFPPEALQIIQKRQKRLQIVK